VFARIARAVGDCQFVFLAPEAEFQAVTAAFRRRLDGAFVAAGLVAADHCVHLPHLNTQEYMATAGQCDVFLDSIGWSGCNSTLESLTHALPVVTMAGALMRGRHSMAILRRIGVTETIAETVDEYVSIAVRLAQEPAWRRVIGEKISEHKNKLYGDRTCVAALEDFLDDVARRPPAASGSPPVG
jgi:predicted O-linked N-acetylglucosamine transferase (SPINDLY family)